MQLPLIPAVFEEIRSGIEMHDGRLHVIAAYTPAGMGQDLRLRHPQRVAVSRQRDEDVLLHRQRAVQLLDVGTFAGRGGAGSWGDRAPGIEFRHGQPFSDYESKKSTYLNSEDVF